MLIRAKRIYPVDQPPIENGFILVRDGIIKDIGPRGHEPVIKDEIMDLSDRILLPGFVNAHCHLELTSLGPVIPPHAQVGNIPFTPWIRELLHRKSRLSRHDVAEGIRLGIGLLKSSGVTTIGDHISSDVPLEPFLESRFSGRLFCEVLGVNYELCEASYAQARLMKLSAALLSCVPSPHSVHAVHPKILACIIGAEHAPLSLHLAESRDEVEYFARKSGPLADLIEGRGLLGKHEGRSGLEHLSLGQYGLDKLLIIHGNCFSPTDLDLIAQHKLSIVHCPGSHAFFGHPTFPLQAALDRGINIAIGTDSLASNSELNFVHELKLLQLNYPQLSFEEILSMATLGGARALRMEDKVGSLTLGKRAHIISVNQTESLFFHSSIAGKKISDPIMQVVMPTTAKIPMDLSPG